MADREVDDALARSFLADLPPELAGRLRAEGERADYPAGTTVARPADEVFAFLADFGNIPAWNYAIARTVQTSPGPARGCHLSRRSRRRLTLTVTAPWWRRHVEVSLLRVE